MAKLEDITDEHAIEVVKMLSNSRRRDRIVGKLSVEKQTFMGHLTITITRDISHLNKLSGPKTETVGYFSFEYYKFEIADCLFWDAVKAIDFLRSKGYNSAANRPF